jgi:ketosteroid isomerase-like protein
MADAAETTVRGIYEAFAIGDIPRFVGLLDPKIEWREAEGTIYANNNPYVGPDAIMNGVIGPLVQDFKGFTVTPAEFVSNGETVIALGTYTGTCAATGKPLKARFGHIWRVRNGKVVGFEQLTDTAQFNVVMAL